ncbi:VOC family protein [Pseudonocardia sp.]|uniref:VOC family protein n=1 Tax=Pseudonocardia sp. TaxID=60912 RepID=UPI003D0CADAB
MARIESATIGAPCWFDLFTRDPARAEEFYGAVLGWTADPAITEFGGYVNFRSGDTIVAGMLSHDGTADHPDGWTVYFATTDAKATADTAVAAGATVADEPMQVGDLGTFAVLVDPAGAPFGLWQPGAHQGFGVAAEAGAPLWFEYHAREYAPAVGFYTAALGVEASVMSDTPEFRYSQLVVDGEPRAGIFDATYLPEGVPSNWQVYLGVPDTDAAVDTVVRLGGRVIHAAEDTPFGRIATVVDPTGAVFRLGSVPG